MMSIVSIWSSRVSLGILPSLPSFPNCRRCGWGWLTLADLLSYDVRNTHRYAPSILNVPLSSDAPYLRVDAALYDRFAARFWRGWQPTHEQERVRHRQRAAAGAALPSAGRLPFQALAARGHGKGTFRAVEGRDAAVAVRSRAGQAL